MKIIVKDKKDITIKKYYRKRKGKRYVINYKYIFPTERDKLKILFGAYIESKIRKISVLDLIPKSTLKELIKGL